MSRAQILEALAASTSFCNGILDAMSAGGLTETYTARRQGPDGTTASIQVELGGLLSNFIAHQNEVYGYAAVYLRLKGIVPPSSARAAGRRGGGPGGS